MIYIVSLSFQFIFFHILPSLKKSKNIQNKQFGAKKRLNMRTISIQQFSYICASLKKYLKRAIPINRDTER